MAAIVPRIRTLLRERRVARRARRTAAARARLGAMPIVAVTGSAGKTTTVSLLARLLGGPPRVGGNLFSNRAEDVFATFDRCGPDTSAVVLEASEFPVGSLARVAEVVRPTVAVLTIAGLDHYVAFRSAAAAAREMALLTRSLPPGGFVVVNADDEQLRAAVADAPVPLVTFGADATADYRLVEAGIGANGRLAITCRHGHDLVRLDTRFVGAHFHVPVLAAAATAHRLGVPWPEIAAVVATFEPIVGRCNLVEPPGGPVFICDSNKAPAWSCAASLKTLDSFAAAPRRTLVVGTLSDYAGDSRRQYRRMLRAALGHADRVIVLRHSPSHVGASAADIDAGRVLFFDTVERITGHIRETALPGEAILLKGSTGADHLDRIAHDFVTPVRCWLDRCERGIDCIRCDRMTVGPPPAARRSWLRMPHVLRRRRTPAQRTIGR